jgi:hypothetical protein
VVRPEMLSGASSRAAFVCVCVCACHSPAIDVAEGLRARVGVVLKLEYHIIQKAGPSPTYSASDKVKRNK